MLESCSSQVLMSLRRGVLESWSLEVLMSWNPGVLDLRSAGVLESRSAAFLGFRRAGVLEWWSPECWSPGLLNSWNQALLLLGGVGPGSGDNRSLDGPWIIIGDDTCCFLSVSGLRIIGDNRR